VLAGAGGRAVLTRCAASRLHPRGCRIARRGRPGDTVDHPDPAGPSGTTASNRTPHRDAPWRQPIVGRALVRHSRVAARRFRSPTLNRGGAGRWRGSDIRTHVRARRSGAGPHLSDRVLVGSLTLGRLRNRGDPAMPVTLPGPRSPAARFRVAAACARIRVLAQRRTFARSSTVH
jgi:hypothetical protein